MISVKHTLKGPSHIFKRLTMFGVLAIFFNLPCAAQLAQSDGVFTIAFGSCNKTDLPNTLWDDIVKAKPDLFIWGGDIVYADTANMKKLARYYQELNELPGYQLLKENTPIIGTWDDHDYGMNDGGVHFKAKKASQQVFLDFMGVPSESPRRKQPGVYAAHSYKIGAKNIKVLVLDTRYFRADLTPDNETSKRNKPNPYGQGTVLGDAQWEWLEAELTDPAADYTLLVSSVQFLSNKHGFECWGNFPNEVDRLEQLLVKTQPKNLMIISGDRHISEISSKQVAGLPYDLVDATSSGLTHAYSAFKGEENPFRISKVVATESFGILKLHAKAAHISIELVTDGGVVAASHDLRF